MPFDNDKMREYMRERRKREKMQRAINHPKHYTSHPSGIECIQITEHMGFCLGNAIKYIWRAGSKGDPIEDLKKARWYIEREIERLTAATRVVEVIAAEGE